MTYSIRNSLNFMLFWGIVYRQSKFTYFALFACSCPPDTSPRGGHMRRFSIVRPQRIVYCGVCFGMLAGCFVAIVSGETLSSVMRMALLCPVSIVGLSVSLFLPFLLSTFAVYLHKAFVLVCICVLKAFSFSCALTANAMLAASAGEPRILLLMFSDSLMFPVLCWFHVLDHGRCSFGCAMLCLTLLTAIGCTDYWFISPLLALY